MGRRAEVGTRGFTLLELLVTLFLIGLATALVAPAMSRSAEGLRARTAVAGFSAALRHAREQAITTREPHTVVVDPATRQITIRTDENVVTRTRRLPDRLGIEALSPTGLGVRFEPYGTSTGAEFRLTAGSATYRVSVDITGRVRSTRE